MNSTNRTQGSMAAQVKVALGYPRYRFVIAGLAEGLMASSFLIFFTLGVLLPNMRAELNFDVAQAGWLGSARWISSAFFGIAVALFAVRYSPKKTILLCMIFSVLAALVLGSAPAYAIVFGVLLAYGLGVLAIQPAVALLWVQWLPHRELGRILGIGSSLGWVFQFIAVSVTPFLVVALGGWRQVFYLYGGVITVFTLAWGVFGKERLTPEYQASMDRKQRGVLSDLKSAAKHKAFWMIGFALVGNMTPWMAMFTLWPTYLLEVRGISLTTAGVLMGFVPIGSIFATLSAGFISDKIGLRKPIIWPCGLMAPLGYLAMLLPVGELWLGFFAFWAGYWANVHVPATQALPFELEGIRPSEVAVGRSLAMSIATLGGILGPALAGFLAAHTGSLRLALTVASFFPLTLFVMGLLLPETGWRRRRALSSYSSQP